MKNIKTTRKIAFAGIIVASAVALGYALAPVPNVELVTFTITLGGFLLGSIWGGICGAIAWAVYSATSPFGMAPLPLYVTQIIGGIIIGVTGGFLKTFYMKIEKEILKIVAALLFGLVITAIFQVLINIGSFISFGSEDTVIIYIISGIGFVILQIVSNSILFSILFPAINRVLKNRK